MSMGLAPIPAEAAEVESRVLTLLVDRLAQLVNHDDLVDTLEDERVQKIRAFFSQWEEPLPAAEYAEDFVFYADLYDVDPYLVAAIAFNESTGFKYTCGYNAFGWAIYPGKGCQNQFTSFSHAIQVITYNLGGHNPATAHFYADKTTQEIINTYNPPRINPKYLGHVTGTMAKMQNMEVGETTV